MNILLLLGAAVGEVARIEQEIDDMKKCINSLYAQLLPAQLLKDALEALDKSPAFKAMLKELK